MSQELDRNAAIGVLNRILELELAGVVRYTPVSYTHLCCSVRMRLSRVVFPAPRKPVSTVTGMRGSAAFVGIGGNSVDSRLGSQFPNTIMDSRIQSSGA